jgi:nicotinate-nucleotide pyrophosphorylase (carboxylating)
LPKVICHRLSYEKVKFIDGRKENAYNSGFKPMKLEDLNPIITAALAEDMPEGDVTSESIIPPEAVSKAVFLAKEKGVLAGLDVSALVFTKIDEQVTFLKQFEDGQIISPGDHLALAEGRSVSLLKGERTALNFLQRLSGIATKTRRFVDALAGSPVTLLDTRKTTPGLRLLEKYAVKMGGGTNHRASLSDMVMIKDNHIRQVGSITEAVRRAREKVGRSLRIEVETTSIQEVKEVLEAGADIIMLDNMSLEMMREVVGLVRGRVPLEVSGNVDLERIKKLGVLGVDYVSVGSLTHSFRSLDISMEFLD